MAALLKMATLFRSLRTALTHRPDQALGGIMNVAKILRASDRNGCNIYEAH